MAHCQFIYTLFIVLCVVMYLRVDTLIAWINTPTQKGHTLRQLYYFADVTAQSWMNRVYVGLSRCPVEKSNPSPETSSSELEFFYHAFICQYLLSVMMKNSLHFSIFCSAVPAFIFVFLSSLFGSTSWNIFQEGSCQIKIRPSLQMWEKICKML